jgi:hypothetical protein
MGVLIVLVVVVCYDCFESLVWGKKSCVICWFGSVIVMMYFGHCGLMSLRCALVCEVPLLIPFLCHLESCVGSDVCCDFPQTNHGAPPAVHAP